MDDLTLAAEFPPATREQWLELVEAVLKGADFEKKLVSRTYDGLRIEPLYPKAEAPPPIVRAPHGPWRIAQRVDHPEPTTANELALTDLEGGADALAFVVRGRAGGARLRRREPNGRRARPALQGVMLDLVAIRLETAPFGGRDRGAQWADLVKRRGVDPAALALDFGLDPFGDMARTGALARAVAGHRRGARRDVAACAHAGFTARPSGSTRARTTRRRGRGAGTRRRARGGRRLSARTRGRRPSAGRRRAAPSFLLVADADEFLTIAKFRRCGGCGRGSRRRAGWRRGRSGSGRDGVAHDHAARSLGQLAAHHGRGVLGRPRRRGRRRRPAVHGGAWPAGRVRARLARNTQLILLEEANSAASPTRPPGQAASRR